MIEPPGARFAEITRTYGPALARLARGYEADAGRQKDLLQEILLALWRALPGFEGRSSLRTWLYRIAHNVAVSHVIQRGRDRLAQALPLDEDVVPALVGNAARELEGRDRVQRLAAAVRALRPLEGLEHVEIAVITGLSRENVAVKIHRLKAALARALDEAEGGGR